MGKKQDQRSGRDETSDHEVIVNFGEFGELSRHEILSLYSEVVAPLESKQRATE